MDLSTSPSLPAFASFLQRVSEASWELKTTATGATTIRQTTRNQLRQEGIAALLADLQALYANSNLLFDIVETADGINFCIETVDGWTFTWELGSTIKAVNYDVYAAADAYAAQQAEAAQNIAAKEKAQQAASNQLKAKREAKESAAKKLIEGTKEVVKVDGVATTRRGMTMAQSE